MASSPCTPQGRTQAQQHNAVLNPSDAVNHHVDTLTEQLLTFTITKTKHKRNQTSATPASHSRPRTQRRTSPVGQDNTPAPAASRQENVTPSRLSCLSELQDELSCAVCLEICVRPCATPCGHAFCKSCLRQALHVKRQCPKCRANLPPASSWQPKVNTALWNTIQLLFPKHAAQAPPPTPEIMAAVVSSNRRATATGSSSGQPRHRHVASMLTAAGVFANDVSVRRSFRPPRPAHASQGIRPRTRGQQQQQQQQHTDQFVMPADLGAMLQDMYHTGTGSVSERSFRSTDGQQVAAAASQWQRPLSRQRQQQQQASQGLQGPNRFTRLRQAALGADETDDWDQVDFNMLDDLASQPAHHPGISSSQGQTEQRQARRAAAAARVHAAIAEDLDAIAATEADDYDEGLRTAILASLHDSESGAAQATTEPAAVQSRSLQPAAVASSRQGMHGGTGRQRQEQRPSRQRSASLFGLMHSGRSPQQQWAVDSDDDVQLHDGLLDDAAATLASVNSSNVQSATTAAAAARPAVINRLSQHEGHEEAQLLTPGVQPQSNLTAAAAHGLNHSMAGARRRHGRARVILDDEEGEAGEVTIGMTPTTAAQSAPATGIIDLNLTANQQGTFRGSMVRLDGAAVPEAEWGSAPVEELEVDVLSLAPSPDPQPLAARLAHFANYPRERQQQPAGEFDRGSSSTAAPAASQAAAAAVRTSHLAVDSMTHDSRPGRKAAATGISDQGLNAPGAQDGDSDEFEPVTHRRLTAALAARMRAVVGTTAEAEGGSARRVPVGRVVAGLRRGPRAKHQQ